MSLWSDLGFRENLYSTPPLRANDEGSQLLVGRDSEVSDLLRSISSLDTHPTIEGDNGVGKTSLVAVASYRALRAFEQGSTSQLFVPLPRAFQLSADEDAFERQVLFALAKAIIDNHEVFERAGRKSPGTRDIEQWLESPVLRQRQGGVSVLGSGISAGGSGIEINTSPGFVETGFRESVRSWLAALFPSAGAGAFVGVIYNLELLETSQEARRRIEAMRDTILNLPGVRWVLCGARGIVRSAAGSPRLTGLIADPMRLEPIRDVDVADVVRRRIELYRITPTAIPPVEPDGFDHLYRVAHKNLRNTLKHAQDFSLWLATEDKLLASPSERFELLEVWLAEQADVYSADTRNVTPRGWKFLDDLIAEGGTCSPSDFERFGFNCSPAMRPSVKQLEDANLVDSTIDESDSRRRTIVVTSNGWLVNYKRTGYQEPLG
jgi:hypothetical protein